MRITRACTRHISEYFERAGLGDHVISVESDPGMMGGTEAHEFMYLNPGGEDTLLLCDTCGYQRQSTGSDI